MTQDNMFAKTTDDRVSDQHLELWPQAAGELWAYANVLERRNADITAAQLRMAVLLANEAYGRRKGG